MKAANRVFKNTMFLYMRMGITVFSSLYATRLILNALGASDFGIFNLVAGLITMLIFLNSTMTQATQRFMSYSQGKANKNEQLSVYSISIILHLIVAIASVLFLELAEPLLFEYILKIDVNRIDSAKVIYQYMIISSFFLIISVPNDAVINAHEDMLFVALLGILESFLKLGIAIFISYSYSDRLIVYGLLVALLSIVVMLIKAIYSFKNYEEVQYNIRKYFDRLLFNKMLHFIGYNLLASTTSIFSAYGVGLVLNVFFGTVINAAQGIVTQVSGQLGAFANTMMKALSPMITKSEGAGDRKAMLNASFIGSKVGFLLLIFFYVPILLEMPIIFKYWLINIPEYTIIFCKLLLVRNLIEQLYITLATSIFSVGNIKHFEIYNTILNIFPLPIAYIMFKLGYPPYYLYIVFIIYSLVRGIIFVYFAKKECHMSIESYFRKVVVPSVLSFVLIFLITAIPHILIKEDLYRLVSVLVVNFFIFPSVVWFIALDIIEKQFVKQILNKIKNKIKF